MNDQYFERAYDFVKTRRDQARRHSEAWNHEILQEAIEKALGLLQTVLFPREADAVHAQSAELRDALLQKFPLGMDYDPATVLTDSTLEGERRHIPWEYREGGFWRRYRKYLEGQLRKNDIEGTDSLTTQTVELLEDPRRTGAWDCRGMVVGQVQSGKTTNYTGVICKAADAGYRWIIVMAGVLEDLRFQTQQRLDAGFLGRDTGRDVLSVCAETVVGVGKISMENEGSGLYQTPVTPTSLTRADEQGGGDFKAGRGGAVGFGGASESLTIAVVKKNKAILENLAEWLIQNYSQIVSDGTRRVCNAPLLLIDDEADNASVNNNPGEVTEGGDEDPTAINRCIRRLLNLFEKKSYLAYTATPFANIFILPPLLETAAERTLYGDDLFPRNFILNLPAPPNYIGPATVFGLSSYGYLQQPLPIIREESDADMFLPARAGDPLPGDVDDLPESLRRAVRSFVLSCAIRRARGQKDVHNSMLVHVSRFISAQQTLRERIAKLVEYESNCMRLGNGIDSHGTDLYGVYKDLWKSDYVRTSRDLCTVRNDVPVLPAWRTVKAELKDALLSISGDGVRVINSRSEDDLPYSRMKRQNRCLNVIVVGGNGLSRGLTLEGLTVSYYMRPAKLYDTLMQMGRWFGYRDGYLDVCRLYTTPQLREWYEFITRASEDLRCQFDRMRARNATPMEFGLCVPNHSGSLKITAAKRLRYAAVGSIWYDGKLWETYFFEKNERQNNLFRLDGFLGNLGAYQGDDSRHRLMWTGVDPNLLLSFLGAYRAHEKTGDNNPRFVAWYLGQLIDRGVDISWTVCLYNGREASLTYPLPKFGPVGLAMRAGGKGDESLHTLAYRRLITLDHLKWGLPEDDVRGIPAKDVAPRTQELRSRQGSLKGLVLLYLLYSPEEGSSIGLPYVGVAVQMPFLGSAAGEGKEGKYTFNVPAQWQRVFRDDSAVY